MNEPTPEQYNEFIQTLNRRLGLSKHSRLLSAGSRFNQFSYTKTNPYVKRIKNRIKNKKARKARRYNRL